MANKPGGFPFGISGVSDKPWELTEDDIIGLYDDRNWRVFDSDVCRAKAVAELQRKKLIEWGEKHSEPITNGDSTALDEVEDRIIRLVRKAGKNLWRTDG